MEFFARDPTVIRKWARHHLTGESIPEGLLEIALDNKEDFAAMDVQHQLLLSGADQVCCGCKFVVVGRGDSALKIHSSSLGRKCIKLCCQIL
jgi:hypothetical protein